MSPNSRDIRVLHVEDNEADYRLVVELLQPRLDTLGESFAVAWAKSVEEAVDSMEAFAPDIILLDLFLPDSDRLSGLDVILKAAPKTPVIILTGLDDEKLAMTAVSKGADDFIQKVEISPKRISRSIRTAVERAAKHPSLAREDGTEPRLSFLEPASLAHDLENLSKLRELILAAEEDDAREGLVADGTE